MHQHSNDTIAAVATSPGKGGVGIVRISGPLALSVAIKISGKKLKPRYATFSKFIDRNRFIIDEGIVLYFQNPNSFTGEDVVEFHGHGSPITLDYLLDEILSMNVRLAKPGEFSERAFLNGKIDLIQAEAIADLIDCGTRQAAKAAIGSLQGHFSKRINEIVQALIQVRMFVESAIDFPEEEIDYLSDDYIKESLEKILKQVSKLKKIAHQGRLLREGIKIVIFGKPNAGKSSLLNQLSGLNSAIVTDIPGTTRDTLREWVQLDGMPVHIIDTAGLRKSNDVIELEGIRRTQEEIKKADHLLLIVDVCDSHEKINMLDEYSDVINKKDLTIIYNKIDMIGELPAITSDEKSIITTIKISAKTGAGLSLLRQHLKQVMGYSSNFEGQFIARRRHLETINKANMHLKIGLEQFQLHKAGELLAEDLRQAQRALSEITGDFTSDDLLSEIFSSFCIGK